MILGALVLAHRFGGHAKLAGDLKILVSGNEIAAQSAIYLHAEPSPRPGNTGPSSLVLVDILYPDQGGIWSAGFLSADHRYTAISYDPTGTHAPAIQAGLQAA